MKSMNKQTVSTQQLHEIQLEILDEFIRLCHKHDLRYVMMGGSCLGAVRHHGMIPWDDDIDVGLDRSDYNRLIEICKQELKPEYFFQHFDTEKNTGFIFGKIRKNHTQMIEEYDKHIDMHHGIWIDVFPFDYVADDMEQFKRDYHRVLFLRNLLVVKQGYKMPDKYGWIQKVEYFFARLFTKLISREQLIFMLKDEMTKYNESTTNTLFPYGCAWAEKERISKDEFYDTISMDFDGRSVSVFRSYDSYLKRMYGNYMEIPKDKEGTSGHQVSNVILNDEESE